MTADETEVCVYALAEPGLPRTLRLFGRTLHILRAGRIDAVVGEDPRRVEPTTAALEEQHAIVTRLAELAPALLPARFGMRVDQRTLRETLASREPEILAALASVRGRRQMTIRIFGEPVPGEPVEQSVETGTEYLKRRQARLHSRPPEVAAVRDALGSVVVDERVEPGPRGLRITIFHLVAIADLDTYRRRAASLRLDPHQVTVSGPFPAFAFTPELL